MKTKKTEESVKEVAQVVFRPSVERSGYYLFHYGYLVPVSGTFTEDSELTFSEFLESVGVPEELLAAFVEDLRGSGLEICDFGYLSQELFDSFMRFFVPSCESFQLFPGMFVLTLIKEEDED